MRESRIPSDVSDEEWNFIAPYLTLLPEDVSQRRYPLREVYNGLRWVVRTGATWRMMPHDLPPWHLVDQQTRRWVVERSFAWLARFRRLALDYERLPALVAGLHVIAFTALLFHQWSSILSP